MPITLAEAKKNTQDALSKMVIDEYAKNNFILNHIPFDNCVSPTGGGTTMTYSYTRLVTQPTAAFREINHEYIPQEVTKERCSADLKIFGGSFELDRVIADMGGIVNETALQMQQKIKAATALFNDTVINGDSAVNPQAFDGLEKMLKGSSTEYKPSGVIDLSTSAMIDTNYKYFLDALDEFLSELDGKPTMLAGNSKLITRIRACARRAGMYQTSKDDFGRQVDHYDGIPLVDLGTKAGTNDPVVSINQSEAAGQTSLYAVRFGLDGFHAVSPVGNELIKTWLPNFKDSGVVKKGEVEMLAAVVLKATKAAGVFRQIKVK